MHGVDMTNAPEFDQWSPDLHAAAGRLAGSKLMLVDGTEVDTSALSRWLSGVAEESEKAEEIYRRHFAENPQLTAYEYGKGPAYAEGSCVIQFARAVLGKNAAQ